MLTARRAALRMLVTGRRAVICRAVTTSPPAQMESRQKAYVRYKPTEDSITISLTVAGRQRNLNRPIDEPLAKPLGRLRANLAPEKGKKVRKKAADADAAAAAASAAAAPVDDTVELYSDAAATRPIDGSTTNLEAWTAASVLRVGPSWYDLALNPPTVDVLTLPGFPMVGYPILPSVTLSFAEPGACSWRWLRRRPGGKAAAAGAGGGSNAGGGSEEGQAVGGGWVDTGCRGMCYTPAAEDVGCLLRVECTPGRRATAAAAAAVEAGNDAAAAGGVPAASVLLGSSNGSSSGAHSGTGDAHTLITLDLAVAAAARSNTAPATSTSSSSPDAAIMTGPALTADSSAVQPGPAVVAAAVRCPLGPLAPAAAPRLRVMSYNILADQYAGTGYAQQVLFNYCPTPLLDNNYRRQLVLQEVLQYQPDVLCLQEVDDKVFADYLAPHLAQAGYRGAYTNKQGRVREGSALFWRTSRLQLLARHDVLLRDVFAPPLHPRHSQFQPLLDASPALVEALQKVTTIAQLVLLAPVAPPTTTSNSTSPSAAAGGGGASLPPLLVANTHLFFHPYAPHIRTLHTAAILEEAAAAVECWSRGQPLQVHPQQQQQQQGAAGDNKGSQGPGGQTPPSSQQQQELAPSSSKQQPTQQQQQQGVSWVSPAAGPLMAGLAAPTLLFCGDLNSDLNDGVPGVVQMLGSGRLAADHWDWSYGKLFRWGKEEGEYTDADTTQDPAPKPEQQQQQQPLGSSALPLKDGHDFDPPSATPSAPLRGEPELLGLDLEVPYELRSADDLKTPYTNYTSGYKALLDYVWHQPGRLQVVQQLPVPSPEQMTGFLPNAAFPSDHLAVVYDLEPQG